MADKTGLTKLKGKTIKAVRTMSDNEVIITADDGTSFRLFGDPLTEAGSPVFKLEERPKKKESVVKKVEKVIQKVAKKSKEVREIGAEKPKDTKFKRTRGTDLPMDPELDTEYPFPTSKPKPRNGK